MPGMLLAPTFQWSNPATWPWMIWVWLAFCLVGWGWIRPAWRELVPLSAGPLPTTTRAIPERLRPFLWLFAGLAMAGLILSLFVHISAVKGIRMVSMFWGMHAGIFVVWFPAMLVARRRVGTTRRRDFWKAVLKGAPVWVRYMHYPFFFYAVATVFLAGGSINGGGSNVSAKIWGEFSAGWMAFYSAAFAILYAAAIAPAGPSCVNGHLLPAEDDMCPLCQPPALPPE
jgi:hypothetical protein